jgi:hypothetical protein
MREAAVFCAPRLLHSLLLYGFKHKGPPTEPLYRLVVKH